MPFETAPQFADRTQQREASTLGMWVFLITEVMFFGGLFTGYAVYRAGHPAAFADASEHLDVIMGALNTAVLITSSLTMAVAVAHARNDHRIGLVRYLGLTIALGIVFLAIKYFEYAHKIEVGLLPGTTFNYPGHDAGPAEIFFSFYFAMTGLHALHMVIGIGMLATLAWLSHSKQSTLALHAPVEYAGLYWHFVDIIWIFLFPLLYLVGRHA